MTTSTQLLVSIVVPVYNVEPYIDECLASIRAQTYTNLEVLLVEDCSTDGSLKALEPHLDDPRLRLIRHERNGGLSVARNTGIDAASGDYLMFVDSDDVIDRTLVEACVQAAGQTSAQVVLCGFTPFKDGEALHALSGHTAGGQFERFESEAYFVYPHFAWLKFMRRELLQNPALRFPVGHYYEDWPFHWDLGFAGAKMVRLRHDGYFYRQHKGSITGSSDRKLFHIFSAHKLVAEVVERHATGDAVRRLLAEKIHQGTWFVLTTVDDAYLREAVPLAKQHFRATRKHRQFAPANIRSVLVKALLSLPLSLATAGIGGLRRILGWLSPARRKAPPPGKLALEGGG